MNPNVIYNIKDLAREVGVPDCFTGDYGKAVARAVYKGTECGCVFDSFDTGVTVAGYAEGADAECPDHYLEYPFSREEWWDTLTEADTEGCQMWYEWNEYEQSEQDEWREDDDRQRAADMNETLRGGW